MTARPSSDAKARPGRTERPRRSSSGHAIGRAAALLALLVWTAACGDAGLSPTPGSSDQTATVSVLLTDAPSADFIAVNLTVRGITLIGPGGQVTLFEGEETFDLLRLRDVSEIFSMNDRVRPGRYAKVRLTLADDGLELVTDDGNGGQAFHYPELPGNDKLDLVLRDPLVLGPGDSAALEIDVDVEKSIHFHLTGNGQYRFRPVVFVRVVRDLLDGRLARVHGFVRNVDLDTRAFELCRVRRPLAWLAHLRRHGAEPGSVDADVASLGAAAPHTELPDDTDPWHPARRCLPVQLTEDASLFDDDGTPIRLRDLGEHEPATVVGRLHPSRDRRLELFGALVLVGPVGTFERRLGIVASDFDEDLRQLVLDLASGNGDLTLQLFPTTKLFERGGTAIGPDAVSPGLWASATGVIVFSTEDPAVMNTAVLILDLDDTEPEPLHGEITAVDPAPAEGECHVTLDVDGAEQGVGVGPRTVILLIDAAGSTSTLGTLADLAPGDAADVYGRADDAGGCFHARAIVTFPATE
jgi:hypothetical protein